MILFLSLLCLCLFLSLCLSRVETKFKKTLKLWTEEEDDHILTNEFETSKSEGSRKPYVTNEKIVR